MNRENQNKIYRVLISILIAVLLGGCVRSLSEGKTQESYPFRAPTLYPTSTPVPPPTEAPPPEESSGESSSGACVDVLSYMQDLTVPDGTEVSPGSTIDKRWEVRNNGTCNWDENYHVRLVAGDEMGAETEQELFPARSGTSAVIRITFTAPEEPGSYRSAWQAYNPNDDPFGDPIYIEIVVK